MTPEHSEDVIRGQRDSDVEENHRAQVHCSMGSHNKMLTSQCQQLPVQFTQPIVLCILVTEFCVLLPLGDDNCHDHTINVSFMFISL